MRALLALALILCAGNAWSHGDAQWIAEGGYKDFVGNHCCGSADCHRITDPTRIKRVFGETAEQTGWRLDGVLFPDDQFGRGLYATEQEDPFYCEWGGMKRCLFVIPEGS